MVHFTYLHGIVAAEDISNHMRACYVIGGKVYPSPADGVYPKTAIIGFVFSDCDMFTTMKKGTLVSVLVNMKLQHIYNRHAFTDVDKAVVSYISHGYFRTRDLLKDGHAYNDVVRLIESSRHIVPVDLSSEGVFGYTYKFV